MGHFLAPVFINFNPMGRAYVEEDDHNRSGVHSRKMMMRRTQACRSRVGLHIRRWGCQVSFKIHSRTSGMQIPRDKCMAQGTLGHCADFCIGHRSHVIHGTWAWSGILGVPHPLGTQLVLMCRVHNGITRYNRITTRLDRNSCGEDSGYIFVAQKLGSCL